MNTDPRGMEIVQWAESMVIPLAKYTIVPRLLSDAPDAWQSWAYELIQSKGIAQFIPPDPRNYADWRNWALDFNQSVPA